MLEYIVIGLGIVTAASFLFMLILFATERFVPRQKTPTPEEIEAMRKRRAEEALAPFWIKPGEKTIDDEG